MRDEDIFKEYVERKKERDEARKKSDNADEEYNESEQDAWKAWKEWLKADEVFDEIEKEYMKTKAYKETLKKAGKERLEAMNRRLCHERYSIS